MQVYDDVLLKWADLTSPAQLHEYDQIYAFQPQTPWQVDVQKDLPAPRPPSSAAAGAAPAAPAVPAPAPAYVPAAPAPAYSADAGVHGLYSNAVAVPDAQLQSYAQQGGLPQPTGNAALLNERPNVPLQERIAVAFQELDEGSKGWLSADELERGFRTRGIDFSTNTAQELFQKGDLNHDGRLDMQEWQAFAAVYPNTIDAVYYRGRDIRREGQLRDQCGGAQSELDRGRQREAELRQQADAQAQQNQALAQQLQDQERQLRELTDRRNLLEGQERALIEQEVKLERQKDSLRMSMHKFKETAAAFDRDAAGHGSPRRSRAPDMTGLGPAGF